METKDPNPIRETDDAARRMGRQLIADAFHATLAVLEPETGMPLASRIAVSLGADGRPVFLASDLSNHSRALKADPRASILFGEPGKGDPLAHPRITVIGRVAVVDREQAQDEAMRERWLERHPKAALYVDFADFRFYRMNVERALLNGGFGKAFVLAPEDLGIMN